MMTEKINYTNDERENQFKIICIKYTALYFMQPELKPNEKCYNFSPIIPVSVSPFNMGIGEDD